MSAIKYLHTEPIDLKLKFPKAKITEKESRILNYMLINFISSDLIREITDLQDHKIIEKTSFYKYLLEISDKDSDSLMEDYIRNGKKNDYSKDYFFCIEYFQKLAGKLLSQYQKNQDRFLQKILYAILCYEYILEVAPFVTLSYTSDRITKLLKTFEEEKEKLIKIFDSRYAKVANKKFIHGQYLNLFKKIKKSNPTQFLQLTQNL